MTVDQTTANKLVTLAVLKRLVAALDADLRAAAVGEMDPGDRKAAKADGRSIGYALLTDPQTQNRITDREAFNQWVRDNHPDEVVTIYSVRASFESAMLERGCTPEGEAIPGIEPVTPTPVLQVKPSGDAEAAIRAELEKGGLSFAGVLDSLTQRGIGA